MKVRTTCIYVGNLLLYYAKKLSVNFSLSILSIENICVISIERIHEEKSYSKIQTKTKFVY